MNNPAAAQAEIRRLQQEVSQGREERIEAKLRNLRHQLNESEDHIEELNKWLTVKGGHMREHIKDVNKFHDQKQVKPANST